MLIYILNSKCVYDLQKNVPYKEKIKKVKQSFIEKEFKVCKNATRLFRLFTIMMKLIYKKILQQILKMSHKTCKTENTFHLFVASVLHHIIIT